MTTATTAEFEGSQTDIAARKRSPTATVLGLAAASRYISAQTLRSWPSLTPPGFRLRWLVFFGRGGGVPCRASSSPITLHASL